MLVFSVSMSLMFGFLSQIILSKTGAIIATGIIFVFVFFAVVFDMIGVAVVSADKEVFDKLTKQNIKGARVGYQLCENCEKVCSFCGDVVGDICSTLCGAGGACIVIAITNNISYESLASIISICVSALIAGMTIFFKALMKEYALNNSNKIILKLGIILEKTIFKDKKKK